MNLRLDQAPEALGGSLVWLKLMPGQEPGQVNSEFGVTNTLPNSVQVTLLDIAINELTAFRAQIAGLGAAAQ